LDPSNAQPEEGDSQAALDASQLLLSTGGVVAPLEALLLLLDGDLFPLSLLSLLISELVCTKGGNPRNKKERMLC
jgi:hypothetical protein